MAEEFFFCEVKWHMFQTMQVNLYTIQPGVITLLYYFIHVFITLSYYSIYALTQIL